MGRGPGVIGVPHGSLLEKGVGTVGIQDHGVMCGVYVIVPQPGLEIRGTVRFFGGVAEDVDMVNGVELGHVGSFGYRKVYVV